jgi:hypothetical protein
MNAIEAQSFSEHGCKRVNLAIPRVCCFRSFVNGRRHEANTANLREGSMFAGDSLSIRACQRPPNLRQSMEVN